MISASERTAHQHKKTRKLLVVFVRKRTAFASGEFATTGPGPV